jgi:hypothetical protein
MLTNFKDQFECLETIANGLADAMEEPWDDIRVDVELKGVQVTITGCCYPILKGEFRDLPDVPMLGIWFYQLARLVSAEEKGFYKKCVFTLTKDGEYKTEYEY